MFGFSLAELLVVFLVALLFIKPDDLPEIARFAGKMVFKGKKALNDLKKYFKEVEQDLGIDEIKNEINRGIAEESAKLKELEATIIVDMDGNEHKVYDVQELREDLSKEEISQEISKLNEENTSKKITEAD